MAGFQAKKGSGGGGSRKNWKKYGMILVGLTMVLSGIEFGLNRDIPAPGQEDASANWTVLTYQAANIGTETAVTRITEATDTYEIKPNQVARLGRRDITDLFESNVTGVTGIVFENAPGAEMFRLDTLGGNISDEIRKRIRLPGGYNLYRVYRGTTPYGQINVIGDNLQVGDYVSVYLMQRVREGSTETMGFMKMNVPTGPVVNATVLGEFSGYNFAALLQKNVSALELSIGNSTEFDIAPLNDTGSNGTLWAASFNLPEGADIAQVRDALVAFNASNVTVSRFGYVRSPPEMMVEGRPVAIMNPDRVQTVMKDGLKENDTVEVRIYMLNINNQSYPYARQMLAG
ncbi:MAG: hypothetical protein V1875_06055 [Candidatus Altiarchaeota archaeon]